MTNKTILQRVIDHLASNPDISHAQIAIDLRIAPVQARGAVQKLRQRGWARATEVNHNLWTWRLVVSSPRIVKEPLTFDAQPNRIDRLAGTYLCPELRTQPYRPGSEQYRSIASRGFA